MCRHAMDATDAGQALAFSWPPDRAASASESSNESDKHKINLRDPAFTLDQAPLLPGCQCYACRKHTRCVQSCKIKGILHVQCLPHLRWRCLCCFTACLAK